MIIRPTADSSLCQYHSYLFFCSAMRKEYVLEHYNPTYEQYQPRPIESHAYNRYFEDRMTVGKQLLPF